MCVLAVLFCSVCVGRGLLFGVDDINSCIRYLAAQKGTYLLEVDGLLKDENGNLPSEDSFDGIHLTPDACKLWRSYLDTHTIQKSATESERSP